MADDGMGIAEEMLLFMGPRVCAQVSVRFGEGISAQTQQTDLARSLDRKHALVVGHGRFRIVAIMLRWGYHC